MAPRKKTETKAKKAAAAAAEPKSRARKKAPAAKKTMTVKAAYAPSAVVSHAAVPHAPAAHNHTYADHRSESYKHYASIMRTIIVFLACVLALVILARIFITPADNQISAAHAAAEDNSRLRFSSNASPAPAAGFNNLDSAASGYAGYQNLRSQNGRP